MGHRVFAYVIDGAGYSRKGAIPIRDEIERQLLRFQAGVPDSSESLVLYDDGDRIKITTEDRPVRFLFVSGKPLGNRRWYARS